LADCGWRVEHVLVIAPFVAITARQTAWTWLKGEKSQELMAKVVVKDRAHHLQHSHGPKMILHD